MESANVMKIVEADEVSAGSPVVPTVDRTGIIRFLQMLWISLYSITWSLPLRFIAWCGASWIRLFAARHPTPFRLMPGW